MKPIFTATLVSCCILSGCSPSIQVVSEGPYKAIITQTYGHPAHTLVVLEKDGVKIAQGEAGGKAVGLHLFDGAAAIGQSLALGLPAALLRPDQTNVVQVGGETMATTGAVSSTATGGTGGNSQAAAVNASTNSNNTNVIVKNYQGKWMPPGHRKNKNHPGK